MPPTDYYNIDAVGHAPSADGADHPPVGALVTVAAAGFGGYVWYGTVISYRYRRDGDVYMGGATVRCVDPGDMTGVMQVGEDRLVESRLLLPFM